MNEENTVANQPIEKTWLSEVSELLARAAKVCVEHGVALEPFVNGAAQCYFDASPETREQIEEKELRAALEQMRESGRIALA